MLQKGNLCIFHETKYKKMYKRYVASDTCHVLCQKKNYEYEENGIEMIILQYSTEICKFIQYYFHCKK